MAQPKSARGLDELEDALVLEQARDQQEGRRLEPGRREPVVLDVDPGAVHPDRLVPIADDREAAEVLEIVGVLEEDAVGVAQAGAIERADQAPHEIAGEPAALDEGIAETADQGEDRGHAGEARGHGAVDHRLRGVGEQQVRAQPAQHVGEPEHAPGVEQRVQPGPPQGDRVVAGAALGECLGDLGVAAGGAAHDRMARGHHVLDQPTAEVDQ